MPVPSPLIFQVTAPFNITCRSLTVTAPDDLPQVFQVFLYGGTLNAFGLSLTNVHVSAGSKEESMNIEADTISFSNVVFNRINVAYILSHMVTLSDTSVSASNFPTVFTIRSIFNVKRTYHSTR